MEEHGHLLNFEDVYTTYFSRLEHFAREYVLSAPDAENIVQDVFFDVWQRREVLSFQINVQSFLFASVKNRCIDFLKHKLIEQKTFSHIQEDYQRELQLKYESLEAFEEGFYTEDDIETMVSKAIDMLPEKCREIFIMNKIEGKRQQQIAAELNISVNTVETQMGIAYKKLKEALKQHPFLIFLLFG